MLSLGGHKGAVFDVAFSPDGQTLASVGGDGYLYLWDVSAGWALRIQLSLPEAPRCLAFGTHCGQIVIGTGDGGLLVWPPEKGVMPHREVNSESIICLTHSPESDLIATLGADGSILLWDFPDLAPHPRLMQPDRFASLGFASQGTQIIAATRSAAVWIIDLEKGTFRQEHQLSGFARAVAHSDISERTAVSTQHEIRLWTIGSTEDDVIFDHEQWGPRPIAFTPDGQHLVVGEDKGLVYLLDVRTAEQIVAYQFHNHPIIRIAISPDGTTAVAGGHDGSIIVFDLPDQS